MVEQAGLPWPKDLARRLGLELLYSGLFQARGIGRELTCEVGGRQTRSVATRGPLPRVQVPEARLATLEKTRLVKICREWNAVADVYHGNQHPRSIRELRNILN